MKIENDLAVLPSHDKNGTAERSMYMILNATCSAIAESGMPLKY